MALSIRSRSVEEKARRVAAIRGTTITAAIDEALDEQLRRYEEQRAEKKENFLRLVKEIQDRVKKIPIIDPRPIDEILYDEDGLPH
jgi:antitoxin VapB